MFSDRSQRAQASWSSWKVRVAPTVTARGPGAQPGQPPCRHGGLGIPVLLQLQH